MCPVDRPPTNQAVEILPSLLYWAPGLKQSSRNTNVIYVDALQVGHNDGAVATYSVPHYAGHGRAFGPFSLEEVLRFCQGLSSRLAYQKNSAAGPLCLTTPPGSPEAHTNASVLLGAYLVFREDLSAEQVGDLLGKKDAERAFPCSWSKPCDDPSTCVMKVKYCWEGFEVARKHNWINLECLQNESLLESFCQKYRTMAFTYDCSWLVHPKILISADPITTWCDPSPRTFKDLWETSETGSTAASTPESEKDPADPVSPTSVISVDKDYVNNDDSKEAPWNRADTQSFRSFLQGCGVSLVVRTNFSEERGMPRPSYNGKTWQMYDIGHIDLQFPDKQGAVPPPQAIASLLESTRQSRPGAVLVHCKSGFGRSVSLACCLAIHDYDIPGSALLGWSRINRPGAIATIEQEKFLLSLNGSADVTRAANRADVGAKVSCGCTVQ